MTLNHWNQVIFLETQIPVLGTIVTNWGWKRTASFSPAWLCKRCQESPVRLAWFKFSLAATLPDGVGRTFELWNTIGLSSHLTKFLSFPQRDRNLMKICTFHDCEGQNWKPKMPSLKNTWILGIYQCCWTWASWKSWKAISLLSRLRSSETFGSRPGRKSDKLLILIIRPKLWISYIYLENTWNRRPWWST